mmetsp:Transcript_17214/g.23655  ORF Transcript_17214/g.23655 Transcript_17214/m.23655 type:complete len:201 (+) Transcript_17214:1615-2217(+)
MWLSMAAGSSSTWVECCWTSRDRQAISRNTCSMGPTHSGSPLRSCSTGRTRRPGCVNRYRPGYAPLPTRAGGMQASSMVGSRLHLRRPANPTGAGPAEPQRLFRILSWATTSCSSPGDSPPSTTPSSSTGTNSRSRDTWPSPMLTPAATMPRADRSCVMWPREFALAAFQPPSSPLGSLCIALRGWMSPLGVVGARRLTG